MNLKHLPDRWSGDQRPWRVTLKVDGTPINATQGVVRIKVVKVGESADETLVDKVVTDTTAQGVATYRPTAAEMTTVVEATIRMQMTWTNAGVQRRTQVFEQKLLPSI